MKIFILIFSISSAFSDLITPEDGATLNHIHVLFEWKQISEAISYDIQISEDENFSLIVYETTDSSLAYIDKNLSLIHI